MSRYKHTQRGTVILGAMIAAAVVALAVGLATVRAVLFALPTLALVGWLFHSLTVEVTESDLCWSFGPGLIHKRVLLSEISSCKPVPTGFLEGWGIHWTRYGWLYNVSGKRAVAIKMRSGKCFAIGTDEPEKLTEALQGRTQIS